MAKMLGDNLQLFVTPETGTTLTAPLGQGNLTINRSGSPIDTSDKNSGRYGTSVPGQKTLTITQAIQPNLPDTAFARLKALDASGGHAVMQIQDITGTAPDNIMFECDMYVDFGNTDANQKAVVGTSITLTAYAAPTVDLI